MRTALVWVALVIGVASPARAQRDTTEDIQMEPVEVVAATPFEIADEAAPFAMSRRLRTDADLGSSPSLSLDEITRTIPGLSVNSREHYALGNRVTMRGLGWRAQFGIRGVQILLDGIPLTTAGGQAFTYVVDPSFVREVEVIRGPASVFWGNAAGGVVAFSTRPSGERAARVRARQVVGSYGLSKTDLQVTPDLGAEHELSAYGSYLAQSGYRAHSDTRLGRLGATGDFSLGENRGLRFSAAYVNLPQADSPGSLPRDLVAENPRQARDAFVENGAGKTQEQGQLGLTYYDDFGAWGRLKATGYGLFRQLENPLPIEFGYITFDRLAGGTRLTLEGRAPEGFISGLEWGVGLEGKWQRDDRIEYENDGGVPGDAVGTDQLETVANQGAFARAAWPVTERLRLSAGARYDRLRFGVDDRLPGDDDGARVFQQVSPSLGASYQLRSVRLFAHFSTALEAPTTTELGNRPDAQGGFNPEVGPERVVGLEAGAQGAAFGGALSYDAALFGMQVRDFLVPYQNDSDETFYRNAGRTRHAGLEAAVQAALPQDVSLAASYTFLHAAFADAQTGEGASLDGNRVPGVPRHLLGASLQWRPANMLWLALDVEQSSAYSVDNQNTAEVDGYTVLDARISRSRTEVLGLSLQPFLALNNVLGEEYVGSVVPNAFGGRYFEPAAGRHWRAGLSVRID